VPLALHETTKNTADIEPQLQEPTHWEINLLNCSNEWTCIALSIDDRQTWIPTPAVGRNCPYNPDQKGIQQCFDEHKYTLILTTWCGNHLRLFLKFRNRQGQVGILNNPWDLYANCQASGGIVLPFSDAAG
jgi:hypothetical protein